MRIALTGFGSNTSGIRSQGFVCGNAMVMAFGLRFILPVSIHVRWQKANEGEGVAGDFVVKYKG